MNRSVFAGLVLGLLLLPTGRAQEKFSQVVRPEDYAAAGLGKLTVEERARLDALVELYRSRASSSDPAAPANKPVAAQREGQNVKAAAAVKEKESGIGFLAGAKVLLKPGTEIEYVKVETRLVGDFQGWKVGTIFALENGQRWRVIESSYSTGPEAGPHKVTIVPGVLGSFFLQIEGVRSRPKVKFIDDGK